MKLKLIMALSLFMIPLMSYSQITYLNPQINFMVYNSQSITNKSDTMSRRHFMSDYAFGFGISNTFSTQSPFYIEVGVNYKTYGDRCCKNLEPVTKGYGVYRYTLLDASIEPKYYFNQKYFASILVKVNWIMNIKGFSNTSDFFLPLEKDNIHTRKRNEMSKDIYTLSFASTGLAFGKEITFKKRQVGIVNIFAESPFKSIIKPFYLNDGYRIPRNIGISFGYGLRDKKYYHEP